MNDCPRPQGSQIQSLDVRGISGTSLESAAPIARNVSPLLNFQKSDAHPSKKALFDTLAAIELEELSPRKSSKKKPRILNPPPESSEKELIEAGGEDEPSSRSHSSSSPASDFSSPDIISTKLDETEKEKHELAFKWCLLGLMIYSSSEFSNTYFLPQFSIAALCWYATGVTLTIALGVTMLVHKRRAQGIIWVPMALLQLRMYHMLLYFSFQPDYYMNDEATTFKWAVRLYKVVFGMKMVLFFQQNILLLEITREELRRKLFVCVMCLQITVIYLRILLGEKFDEKDFVIFYLVAFLVVGFLVANACFTFIVFRMQTLTQRIFDLEVTQNQKYKYMFNSLQDSILLVREGAVLFQNKLAAGLLREATKQIKRKAKLPASEMDLPLVYPFQQDEQQAKKKRAESLSLNKLLAMGASAVNSAIFTNSKQLSKAGQMDQVQKIIDESDGGVAFFQIKLIPVHNSKGSSFDVARPEDDVMIQIQDISLRIQSQYLKVEREYMSIMNSTVSHEMRNPLNAIVSQTFKQAETISSLEQLLANVELLPSQKERLRGILDGFAASLRVSKSSTNLIRFNVEDILALPQLKAGKFTKNIKENNLTQGAEEIVSIMEYQAKAKLVHLRLVFKDFPESEDNGQIVLPMDIQRFQQVLLNFLSNALKFTERRGKITIVLQYVRPMTSREKELGLSAKDEIATATLQEALDDFYGEDFLEDSDSDSDGVESSSDGTEESGSKQSRPEKLGVQEKFKFRGAQRGKLDAMLTRGESPKLLLSLLDSGVGIKVEDQMKLFKLFGCLKSTRKINTQGVGLGLSITKMISEEFGGSVVVHSKKGRGSVFQSSISIVQEATSFVKKSKEEEELREILTKVKTTQIEKVRATLLMKASNLPLPGKDKQILVIDDEAYNVEVLKSIIVSLGIPEDKVVCCLSGKEGLQLLEGSMAKADGAEMPESRFALIFTDLSMPLMDGYRFASKTRKFFRSHSLSRKDQPLIVALTGHTESEFYMQAFWKGVDQVYSKPVERQAINLVLLEQGFDAVAPQVMP